jgi:hypothetical protein
LVLIKLELLDLPVHKEQLVLLEQLALLVHQDQLVPQVLPAQPALLVLHLQLPDQRVLVV